MFVWLLLIFLTIFFIFYGDFLMCVEKFKIGDIESIVKELRDNKIYINNMFNYNLKLNIFEKIHQNKIKGIEIYKTNGLVKSDKLLLSVINKINRGKYIDYLKKNINYIKYAWIIQSLIKEIIDSDMEFDVNIQKVKKWSDDIYKDFVGMNLLFKKEIGFNLK